MVVFRHGCYSSASGVPAAKECLMGFSPRTEALLIAPSAICDGAARG